MPFVYVNETDTPDGAKPIHDFFEMPRVPVVGETMEFATAESGESRIVSQVKTVAFEQGKDGKFTAAVTIQRNRPSDAHFL